MTYQDVANKLKNYNETRCYKDNHITDRVKANSELESLVEELEDYE